MIYAFKLRRLKTITILLLLASLAVVWIPFGAKNSAKPALSNNIRSCLVIDPGHGGRDGGAISMGGNKESEINLAIALRMERIAELCGQAVVLTRRDDSGADPMATSDYSERRELEQRVEIANAIPNAMFISIHQNFYPTSEPKGAQVLYAAGEESEAWGNLTQNNLVACLDRENRRLAMPAPKSLYITSHVSCPALLVECGFMSNFSDVEKLLSKTYQTSLAVVLLASYLQFNSARTLT